MAVEVIATTASATSRTEQIFPLISAGLLVLTRIQRFVAFRCRESCVAFYMSMIPYM